MSDQLPTNQALRDLWLLGRRFAAFASGASSATYKPTLRKLGRSVATVETLGVAIDAAALEAATPGARKKLLEKLRSEMGGAAARVHGEAARPVVELSTIAIGLDRFARAEQGPARHQSMAGAQKPAAAFLAASKAVAPIVYAEVEELRGWCEAILRGWAHELDVDELAELLEEPFSHGASPELPEPDDDPPYDFFSAPLEHVLSMVLLHYLLSVIFALRSEYSGAQFAGDTRSGRLAYSDQSESHYAVAWNEHGIVGLAFHKYSEGDAAARWLGVVPEPLQDLVGRLPMSGTWTSGFWITEGVRHRDGQGDEDGGSWLECFTSRPRYALFDKLGNWSEDFGFDEERVEVALTLARRARAGGGPITSDEAKLLMKATTAQRHDKINVTKLRRAQAAFARLGLVFSPPKLAGK